MCAVRPPARGQAMHAAASACIRNVSKAPTDLRRRVCVVRPRARGQAMTGCRLWQTTPCRIIDGDQFLGVQPGSLRERAPQRGWSRIARQKSGMKRERPAAPSPPPPRAPLAGSDARALRGRLSAARVTGQSARGRPAARGPRAPTGRRRLRVALGGSPPFSGAFQAEPSRVAPLSVPGRAGPGAVEDRDAPARWARGRRPGGCTHCR